MLSTLQLVAPPVGLTHNPAPYNDGYPAIQRSLLVEGPKLRTKVNKASRVKFSPAVLIPDKVQVGRQTNKQTDEQPDRQPGIQTGRWSNRQMDRQTPERTDGQVDRQTDKSQTVNTDL